MIPQDYITAWSRVAPWASQRQVEQDLIISRALVAIFSDPFLRGELRFRGGTALNKLHFPAPLRYSEDIDLVRTTAGPIGPVFDRVHDVLDPWLGKARPIKAPLRPNSDFASKRKAEICRCADTASRSKSTRASGKPTIRPSRFRSASKIRGSPARRQSRLSRGRKCWRPSCGPCFNATRAAICSISITRSLCSRG